MSSVGHVASGFGQVAAHGAGELARVATPIGKAVSNAAVPVGRAVATAAPVVAQGAAVALDAAQIAVALTSTPNEEGEVEEIAPTYGQPTFEGQERRDTQDLCLDCPDVGNCNSCLDNR